MPITFESRSRLLFIGDSITDCDRAGDPEHLGFGYVRLIRDYLFAKMPVNAPQVLNFGISGHKVTDLARRWSADVIAQRPDVLSIKIGVNDVWHGLDGGAGGVPVEQYRAVYSELLTQTQELLPSCRLVLCEPSVIQPPAHARGNEILAPYVRVVHDLGNKYHADAIIPLHSAFMTASKERPDIAWTTDGVHPTSTGHMLIARTWLETTRNL
jgi:lysophospholipase L1-like esterase